MKTVSITPSLTMWW